MSVLHPNKSARVQGFSITCIYELVEELKPSVTFYCCYSCIPQSLTAGCMEPTPPSRGSIDNFQSAAEGATITYSCSPGLVPRSQMSAVCTNMAWRPDPATLQCREPGEYCL